MLVGRPLRDDEFAAWLEHTRDGYAADMIDGGIPEDEAREKAARDLARLLPAGRRTPGHVIHVLEDKTSGERRGVLWFAEETRGNRKIAYVYDVEIDEPYRGRGLGRECDAALRASRARARR